MPTPQGNIESLDFKIFQICCKIDMQPYSNFAQFN